MGRGSRLALGVARGLPMVCANPDLVVMVGTRIVICAGTLARRYEQLGGTVRYHGKPHRGVYDRIMQEFAGIPRDRICAIGDTLRTDIAGAASVGIHSFLVTGGVHAEEFGAGDEERRGELTGGRQVANGLNGSALERGGSHG